MSKVPCAWLAVGGERVHVPMCAPAGRASDVAVHQVTVADITGDAERFVDPRLHPPTEAWRRPVEGSVDVSRRPFVAVRQIGEGTVEFVADGELGKTEDGELILRTNEAELPVPIYSFDPCRAYEAQRDYPVDVPDLGGGARAHADPAPYCSIDLDILGGRLSRHIASVPSDVRTLDINGKSLGDRVFYWSWLPSLARFKNLERLYLRHVTIDAEARYSIESLPVLKTLCMIDCGVSGMRPPGWRAAGGNGTTLRHLTINLALLRANPYLQTVAYGSVVLHMTDPMGTPEATVRLDERMGPAALTLVYPRQHAGCHSFSPPHVSGANVLILDGSPDGAIPKGINALVRMRLQNMRASATRAALGHTLTVGSLELPNGIGEEYPGDAQCACPMRCSVSRVYCAHSDPRAYMYVGSIQGASEVFRCNF